MYLDYERSVEQEKIKYSTNINSKCVSHTGPIIGLSYTTDGCYLISLGKDNALRLWNSSTGVNTLMNYGKIPLNSAVAETCIQISMTEGNELKLNFFQNSL